MTLLSNKNFIVSLIREDLRYQRLLLGLEQLGLQSDFFGPELFPLVLDLMGIKPEQRKNAYKLYFDFLDEHLIPVNYYELPEALKELSKALQNMLGQLAAEK